MPQSLAQVWLHVVFSTKERRPFLQDEIFRKEMFRMLAHHIKETGCASASVGGYVDHVHLLVGLSRTITMAKLVEQIKTETSKWAKSSEGGSSLFSWQAGYGAFSVSYSKRDDVDAYICRQSEHHAKLSFQDEFRKICERHGIEIDERYVWD
jgi:REP element-mobilizing transposase RayT